MTDTATPAPPTMAAPESVSAPAGEATVAPYALVRSTALSLPPSPPAAARFRSKADRLAALMAWCAQVSEQLGDELYDRIASAAPDLRNRVLLPLRRDVHNQRTPRPGLRERLSELPWRLPLLERWLAAREEIERLGHELGELSGPALAADRGGLAELCGAEALRRAVTLTGSDLLHAADRAAVQGAAPDARARKSEATVLRYAMRAATKTTPLSWFAHTGWGCWQDKPAGTDQRCADRNSHDRAAASQADRVTLGALVGAVLGRRDLRGRLPHRLAPGLREDGTQVRFRRPGRTGDGRPGLVSEEEVTLPLTAPLRHVLAHLRAAWTVLPRDLAADVAARLPGAPERAEQFGAQYVTGLIDSGLLRPAWPVDPQAPDATGQVARWLAGIGLADLASAVADLAAQSAGFAHVPAADRAGALARLNSRWAEAFAAAGSAGNVRRDGRRMPVTEDVTVGGVIPLGAAHGGAVLGDLTRLLPLLELFDQYALVRRAARERFVARFGAGGRCGSIAEFAGEYGEAWRILEYLEARRVLPDADRRSLSPELRDLVRIREELVGAVPAVGEDGEILLPGRVVEEARRRLPGWVRARPTSYAVFAQPVPESGSARLCVNHVYGGWGRFTSRFLPYLEPAAAEQVRAQIARAASGRVAQIRPVGGFNANLHPLLAGEEIADETPWGTLLPEDLELVHDTGSDQVRVRIGSGGEPIDVLYLGFLVPIALPARLTPLLMDLGSGLVDLGNVLVSDKERDTALGRIHHRPRLRYHGVILSRAQWRLSASMVRAWRDDLDREEGPPVGAAARWRSTLGLPEKLFVSAAYAEGSKGLEGFLSYFAQARSQYVDLGSALHLRCLSRALARYPQGVILEEALPEPQAGVPATEIVTELYRRTP
ncbi:lantibiotic dehydratase [Streptosporangium sp. NPDC000396]|uniref:lantibiotic dehydratase n=1 Tax=Streptosporangium sp. NPDC000396 TaxID=3366185 RepID=UPI003682C13D